MNKRALLVAIILASVLCATAPAQSRHSMAPVPLALVCFRACPPIESETEAVRAKRLDALNEAIMHGVNATGKAFLSHTKLNDKLTLRLSIGNIRTTERHVRRVWELLNEQLQSLI